MNRAINVLLFSSDPFVAYLYIAYVLSIVWLVHRDAVVCHVQGKVPGVYDDWEECRRQVHHFSGSGVARGWPGWSMDHPGIFP